MTVTVLAFQPSYWQRLLLGLVVILAVVPALALLVELVRRHVVEPRAAGRRWPEGLGRWVVGELAAEVGAAVQTEDLLPRRAVRLAVDLATALATGAAFASLIVVSVTVEVRAVRPENGVVVFPVTVLVWGLASAASGFALRHPGSVARVRAAAGRRALAAGVLALAALAVAQQAGEPSLPAILNRQAIGGIFTHNRLGLPYALPQVVAFVGALVALHALAVSDDPADGPPVPVGGLRRVVAKAADTVLLVSGAAWVAMAFLGGGALPWEVKNAPVRTVFGVAAFGAKVVGLLALLLWALGRWPRVALRQAVPLLLGASLLVAADVGVTVAVRAWF